MSWVFPGWLYHLLMRPFFLALMIALLPLRGWVGDVMAMERVDQALLATPAPAAHGDCHEAQLHHGHEAAGDAGMASPAGHDSVHAGGDCSGCTACQICHSVALTAGFTPGSPAALATALPPTPAQHHASAEPAPGFKPPIS